MRKNYFSLLLLLLCAALGTQAATISFNTLKAVGEKFTIAMNPGVEATVTWDDGTEEPFISLGSLQTLTLRSQKLSITTSDDITTLYVANDSITSMDITGLRTTLSKLYCANNFLSSLNLSNFATLDELDCSNNNMTSLRVNGPRIVNCSDNNLTSFSPSQGARLQQLYIANNNLRGLTTSSMTRLQYLFAQNNAIRSNFQLRSSSLKVVDLSGNDITRLTASNMSNLNELWIGNNQLTSLDLTSCPQLVGLVAPGNQLTNILWNDACEDTLSYINVADNNLFFNSFPTTRGNSKLTEVTLGPQNPYPLVEDGFVYANQEYNWGSGSLLPFGTNGWGGSTSVSLKIFDSEGNQLKAGNDSLKNDFRNRSRRITFWEQSVGKTVTITATSFFYRGITLTTTPFLVTTPTGIDGVKTNDADDQTEKVYYNLSGQRVEKPTQGVYIVNGKKVIIR